MAATILASTSNLVTKFRILNLISLQTKAAYSSLANMESSGVVPDVIPVAPAEILKVIFVIVI